MDKKRGVGLMPLKEYFKENLWHIFFVLILFVMQWATLIYRVQITENTQHQIEYQLDYLKENTTQLDKKISLNAKSIELYMIDIQRQLNELKNKGSW